MTEKGGTGILHNSGNKKGNPGPREGGTEKTRTPEDEELARRRFAEYVRITKQMEPGSYENEDVIKVLPMDGGSRLDCGDTRFEHLMNEVCKNPGKQGGPRCGKEMRNGKLCDRQLGHPDHCWSKTYRDRQKRLAKARREKRASLKNKVD